MTHRVPPWIWSLLLLGVASVYLLPVVLMLVGSLKPDERVLAEAGSWRGLVPLDPTLANYRAVLADGRFLRYLFNSLVITGAVIALGLLVNAPCGYALARLSWRGRGLVLLVVLALLVIPFEAVAVPLFVLMREVGWVDSYSALIIPFIASPFAIYLFYTFFNGLPRELEEAARLDGASTWRTYWTIIVPLSGPAFASTTILTFLVQWGAYLWPLLAISDRQELRPLPLAIGTLTAQEPLVWGQVLAFATLMILPVMVVFLCFQRWFVRGIASAGLKG